MIQVVVTGAAGRMGRRVVAMIQEDVRCELGGAVAYAGHIAVGRDAGELAGGGPTGITVVAELSQCLDQADVVIDFSVPAAGIDYMRQAARASKAFVTGTTGFSSEQQAELKGLSETLPCLVAPNMSVGVQAMFNLLQQAATLLGPEFDVEIMEAHHRTKMDAPSGTALRMGELIADMRGRRLDETAIHGREGIIGRRSDTEIGIQAIRGGDIVGEHTVMFIGTGERIELIHRSQSRDNFVRGAIRAALWVVTQPPGLYGMEDLLRAA